MFEWLRRKLLTAAEVKAYKSGQELGNQMAQALSDYEKRRFEPLHETFLNVFRERLQSAVRSEEAPPLLMAKTEAELFCENLEKLKMELFDETISVRSRWLAARARIPRSDHLSECAENDQ